MADKLAFKTYIKSFAKWNGQNFDEAIANVNECYKSDALPQNVKSVFDLISDKQTSTFWLCVAAMARFYEAEKRLPVSGVLPDMISTTDFYLRLQEIYINKAKDDALKMRALV
jgi:amyloid beta precursor protein binding protein 1